MDRFFCHLEYLNDCPPIGGLFKQWILAQSGKGNDNKPSSKRKKKDFKSDEERKMYEKTELHKMIADFGPLQPKPKRKMAIIN